MDGPRKRFHRAEGPGDGFPVSPAFPSRGRCPEGADRAEAVWKTDGIKALIPSHSSPVTPPTSPFSHVLSHAIIGKIHAFVAQLDRAAVS